MPLQETSGTASYDAFGGGPAVVPNYIEDVFSTWLYTGNGATQTITNGIDLSIKGGLVWIKSRTTTDSNSWADTARGVGQLLYSDSTLGQQNESQSVTAFNTSGFSLGGTVQTNRSNASFASWTFRKQPKFFDVVTGTGPGTFNHNLGSVPGCIIFKVTNAVDNWSVAHRSLTGGINGGYLLRLNTTAAQQNLLSDFAATSTTINTTAFASASNTWVAYLFAHDAGGFGLTGTDNVISCGSYTGNGSSTGPTITLNYEPQFVLIKSSSVAGTNWNIIDNMRGFDVGGSNDAVLRPNLADAEATGTLISPTATGFEINTAGNNFNQSGQTYIYIAIRRGPMKTPTTGTSVFSPITSSAATGTKLTTNFPVDMQINRFYTGIMGAIAVDRLRGVSTNTTEYGSYLRTTSTDAESSSTGTESRFFDNTGFQMPSGASGSNYIFWNFGRAPGFFDVVCYTGTGANRTVNHNLGVVPELMIIKNRTSNGYDWAIYSATLGNTKILRLNLPDAEATNALYWNNTTPTSSVFSLGINVNVNQSADNYVAYLFASCPGVSKVGSYTGTGALQTINCGFTGGARFVLIKRTNTTGDWWLYDSARGISSGNDPYLWLNLADSQDSSTNYIDTDPTGFKVTAAAPAGLNANGSNYIFLAIA
jgi:hypothetical protein